MQPMSIHRVLVVAMAVVPGTCDAGCNEQLQHGF